MSVCVGGGGGLGVEVGFEILHSILERAAKISETPVSMNEAPLSQK